MSYAVCCVRLYFSAVSIKHPIVVYCPIPVAVRILFDSDYWSVTIISVFSIVYGYRITVHESDGISNRKTVLADRYDVLNVIVCLECIYKLLE